MRKPIATTFKDVRVGDVVCEKEDEHFEVTECKKLGHGSYTRMLLLIKGSSPRLALYGHPDLIIGLLYRPYPEGKTESDMLNSVHEAADALANTNELDPRAEELIRLREAMDAYELGKPLKTAEYRGNVHPQVDASSGQLGGGYVGC